jgi:formylglycine-generating enzyme required for sulfatase activity
MLETRFKIALLVTVAIFASFPIMGILRGTSLPPVEPDLPQVPDAAIHPATDDSPPVAEIMVAIPAGPFTRGTTAGGFDEQPVRSVHLDAYSIDKYEVTNHQYATFVAATGHRKAGPPSRYAKNMARMRGVNQPVVYVSWADADAYCRWKGKRLPTEAEWEKAMRGTDARLWPWGNDADPLASNWAVARDGYDVTAPVGSFKRDVSPFGVADGAGNVLEWAADWYGEDVYRDAGGANPKGPEFGTFKVLRGGGYTTSGTDVRVTSRSKMVPDFRDETIGFRCAVSGVHGGKEPEAPRGKKSQKIKVVENKKHG